MKRSRWRERDVTKLIANRPMKAVSLPNLPRLAKSANTTKEVVVAFERERVCGVTRSAA